MTNLADFIERFILQKLTEGATGHVLVRRNELADELSCAPSQISYVLSTRFTLNRGYLVESRRGAGGFVRIARLEPAHVQQAPAAASPPSVPQMIDRLAAAQMITKREEAVLQQLFSVLGRFLDEEAQRAVFRQTVEELSAHS